MSGKYGEPWHGDDFYQDGYHEVGDSDALLVCRSGNQHEYARSQRDRLVACVNACSGLSDSALDAGVVDRVREALEAALGFVAVWGGRYQAEYGLDDVHPKHQEALEQVQAALALLRESE